MKHTLHYELTCNDAPAPAWVELPAPTRSNPPAVPVAESQPCAESRGHGDVASAQDGGRAGPINGAAQAQGTQGGIAEYCAERLGRTQGTPSQPAAAPPSAPLKVGDKVMVRPYGGEWLPAIYKLFVNCGTPHETESLDGIQWIHSHKNIRHPTPAELAEHWPDEWIPCVSEAQRLALGDAKVDLKWHDGQVILQTWTGPDYSWGNFITHYRLARSA